MRIVHIENVLNGGTLNLMRNVYTTKIIINNMSSKITKEEGELISKFSLLSILIRLFYLFIIIGLVNINLTILAINLTYE